MAALLEYIEIMGETWLNHHFTFFFFRVLGRWNGKSSIVQAIESSPDPHGLWQVNYEILVPLADAQVPQGHSQ